MKKNPMKKKNRFERGQALIIIVVALVGLIGITALAVDGGNAYAERRAAQNAVDNAALAAALARIRNNEGNWVDIAYMTAAQQGYNNDGVTNTVVVYSPPISGSHEGDIEYIQVTINVKTRTYFAGIVGMEYIENFVKAESRTKTPEWTQILGGNAVISLAPTSDCQKKRGLEVSGESTLDISGGGIFVNSNNAECALKTYGSGSIRIEGGYINVVGGASVQKPQLITPYPPLTGATAISYPPPFLLPKVACPKEATVSEDGKSMTAGTWDEAVFPPEGVTGLQPGAYCLDGDFIVNGNQTLTGNGVVIMVEHGEVHFDGHAQVNLSAPPAGQNKGLLLYLPIDNESLVVLNGNSESSFMGTIMAPSSEIRLKGNESGFGFHSQIIGYRIMSDGQSNIVIKYFDDQNYDTMTMPEIQFTE